MRRSDFGNWGAGLSGKRFAGALAAAGALFPVDPPIYAVSESALADAWDAVLERWWAASAATPTTRVRLAVAPPRGRDPRWLMETLAGLEHVTVHARAPAPSGRRRWTWPLQLGLMDDP